MELKRKSGLWVPEVCVQNLLPFHIDCKSLNLKSVLHTTEKQSDCRYCQIHGNSTGIGLMSPYRLADFHWAVRSVTTRLKQTFSQMKKNQNEKKIIIAFP